MTAEGPADGSPSARITVGTLTGVIGVVEGATLLWLCASMLFQARIRAGGNIRRWSRRVGRGVLGVLLALVTSWPVGGAFVTANQSDGYDLDEPPLDPADERVTLQTEDGLRLAAAYRPSKNRAGSLDACQVWQVASSGRKWVQPSLCRPANSPVRPS